MALLLLYFYEIYGLERLRVVSSACLLNVLSCNVIVNLMVVAYKRDCNRNHGPDM
jgi:hypothetical protein